MIQTKRIRRYHLLLTVLGLLSLSTMGCSGKSGPKLVRVTGVVTMDGEPLADVSVHFEPQSNEGSSWGRTDADGHFEVYYTANQPGAVVGNHRVRFRRIDLMDADAPAGVKHIPKEYMTGSKGLEVELSDDELNFFAFDLSDKTNSQATGL